MMRGSFVFQFSLSGFYIKLGSEKKRFLKIEGENENE